MLRPHPRSTLFPYTTLFRSLKLFTVSLKLVSSWCLWFGLFHNYALLSTAARSLFLCSNISNTSQAISSLRARSEEHTSELQSQSNLVCRLLLEKKHISLQSE